MGYITTISLTSDDEEYIKQNGIKLSSFVHNTILKERDKQPLLVLQRELELIKKELALAEDNKGAAIRFIQSLNKMEDYLTYKRSLGL